MEGVIIPAWGWERVSRGDSPEHLACPSWVNAGGYPIQEADSPGGDGRSHTVMPRMCRVYTDACRIPPAAVATLLQVCLFPAEGH